MNVTTENKAETRNSTVKAVFEVDDPMKELAELAHIVLNLRHHSRLFDTHFGFQNRINKRHWEAKADRWVNEHKVKTEDNGG